MDAMHRQTPSAQLDRSAQSGLQSGSLRKVGYLEKKGGSGAPGIEMGRKSGVKNPSKQ